MSSPMKRCIWIVASIVALGGCVEELPGPSGTQSLHVEVLDPTPYGTPEERLPDDALTLTVKVTAHDERGIDVVDTSLDGEVEVYAQFLGNLTPELGTNPLDNSSLADTPFDNITPSKAIANARFTQSRGLWWVEYGVRAQGDVTRVATTLLESPFLIAQDLLSLDGFAVQRAGAGINLTSGRNRVGVALAVENITDRYYREQFQFAPARGRTFTIGLSVGAF